MVTIQELLEITLNRNASDLHLIAGAPPYLRIHGELLPLKDFKNLPKEEIENLVFTLLNPEQKEILLTNKELDFSFEFQNLCRFRVNAYFQRSSLAASFRLIPLKIKTIEELGLPSICHQFTKLKQGFVLITGPTGHGKSTTLASIIDEISKTRACHIVTIEDPIEFVFQNNKSIVSQRELGIDTYSWTSALKAVFREDPDVILIGEMRDYDTISSALTLAETGHLVFSTLHTNSASQTIERIIDIFPEEAKEQIRIQLSTSLEAVLSQRLVPTVTGERTVAYEIMKSTPAIKTSIRENKLHQIDNIIQTSEKDGMIPLEKSLAILIENGKVTLETARLFSTKPKEIISYLKYKQI